MFWIIKDTNYDATKYYLDIIEKAIKLSGHNVMQLDSVSAAENGNKNDVYIVTTPLHAAKILFMGKKRIIIWFQGAFSDESYMKHANIIKKVILEKLEKIILNKSEFVFFVSDEMKKYYSDKFKLEMKSNYIIMPCFNSKIKESSFHEEDKYKKNIFCYAGSLSTWQGFDKILKCYSTIEKYGIPNTQLLVLTNEKKKAEQLIKNENIQNYYVDYVELQELPAILSKAKFGFITRENNIINRVATPTKISTYMANGVIPIYSECLIDFHKRCKDMKYIISFDDKEFYSKIKYFMKDSINSTEIFDEYAKLFADYFNEDIYINKIVKSLEDIYKENEKIV